MDKRLYDQYQSNHTFVSSKLDHYKFRIDSDCSDNPYFVGSEIVDIFKYGYYPNGGNWSGSFKDVRRDSSEAGRVLEPNTPKAKLPKTPTAYGLGTTTAVDATVEDGVKRYTEKNQHIMIDDKELNMEDYPNLRESLYLQEQDGDFDDGANTTNMGVHTTNRIRVKYPVIENKTYVTGSMAESVDILGERSPKWQNNEYQYYSDNPVEYLDDLFYNVKVVNGADSVKANQYYHHGNVLHGKLKVTMVLPSIVRSASLTGRDIYLFYKKADGQMEQMTLDDATAKGFEFKIASRHINAEKQEVITFEIRTPGDYGADPSGATYYEDFLKGGKKLPGYFGYKDTLVVGIRTKV